MSNYRITVTYSEDKKAFIARVPELESCEAEGETRAEAITRVEEELTAQLEVINEQGEEPPVPLDLLPFDGKLTLNITPELHRDLVFLAQAAKVELEVLITEILTRASSGVWRSFRSGGGRRQEGGRRREGQGQRYHEIMENRADFIEYVRRLESGPQGGRGGGSRRGGGGRGRRDGRK
jgi:predicted RNase H-like HicB family nuclease